MKTFSLRAFILPPALAPATLLLLFLLSALQPSPVLSFASAAPLLTTTGTYTIHLPVVLRDFTVAIYPNDPYFTSQWVSPPSTPLTLGAFPEAPPPS